MKRIMIFGIRHKNFISLLSFVFLMATPFYFTHAAGMALDVKIKNPLGDSITTLPGFIEAALNMVLVVGVPIVALAIIYSGFLFVSAQGNSEKISEAKNTLKFTLIGAALLLGSWVIAQAIQGTIAEIKRTT
jgi:vacuolar-type H+-ATPase subunit I/STV1